MASWHSTSSRALRTVGASLDPGVQLVLTERARLTGAGTVHSAPNHLKSGLTVVVAVDADAGTVCRLVAYACRALLARAWARPFAPASTGRHPTSEIGKSNFTDASSYTTTPSTLTLSLPASLLSSMSYSTPGSTTRASLTKEKPSHKSPLGYIWSVPQSKHSSCRWGPFQNAKLAPVPSPIPRKSTRVRTTKSPLTDAKGAPSKSGSVHRVKCPSLAIFSCSTKPSPKELPLGRSMLCSGTTTTPSRIADSAKTAQSEQGSLPAETLYEPAGQASHSPSKSFAHSTRCIPAGQEPQMLQDSVPADAL
eukprot:3940552-Rhodomonas_salina.1